MIRRSFDINGDYAINSFITESEATIQAVKTRLQLFKGEYFLDLSRGVPYYTDIFIKPAKIDEAERIIKAKIQNTEGVDQISEFTSSFDSATRELTISYSATDIYGNAITDILGVTI